MTWRGCESHLVCLVGGKKKWRKRPLDQTGGERPRSMPEVCPDAAEQLRQQQESYQNSSAAQSMMAFRALSLIHI